MKQSYAQLNQGYDVGEVDSFTPNRYRQFFRYLDLNDREKIVLDVGCKINVHRVVLKELSGKISNFVGEKFPILSIYGSYLAIADKPKS